MPMTRVGPAAERVPKSHRPRERPPEFSDRLPSRVERLGISTLHLNTDFPRLNGDSVHDFLRRPVPITRGSLSVCMATSCFGSCPLSGDY